MIITGLYYTLVMTWFHREFYRLHESAVELTKVTRLLIAVDKEEVNKFTGKKLGEINLEGNNYCFK